MGDGSTHIKPNHSLDVHVCSVVGVEECVGAGTVGGDVIVFALDVVVASLQPHIAPGVAHVEVEVGIVDVGSLQPPKKPGLVHVVVGLGVGWEVVVTVGIEEDLLVVVTSSLQPNQPGVLHVEVEDVVVVVVLLVEVCCDVVAVSSRHPHQPGVLHVSVRVLVFVVVVELDVVVVPSVPLLSKNFQLKQSTHSESLLHSATLSYILSTLSITLWILWVVIDTLQPFSATTSYSQVQPVWHTLSIAYPANEQVELAPLQVPI